jgi:hypothetical protein
MPPWKKSLEVAAAVRQDAGGVVTVLRYNASQMVAEKHGIVNQAARPT